MVKEKKTEPRNGFIGLGTIISGPRKIPACKDVYISACKDFHRVKMLTFQRVKISA